MGKTAKLLREKEKKEIAEMEAQKLANSKFETSNSQWLWFSVAGLFTAAVPLWLFVTPIYDVKIIDHLAFYIAGILVSAVFLISSYSSIALKSRKFLIADRILDDTSFAPATGKTQEDMEQVLIQGTHSESCNFAIFVANCSFLGLFAFSLAYVLKPYDLNPEVNFVISTALPAAITFVGSKLFR